jgi:hypothetical protein
MKKYPIYIIFFVCSFILTRDFCAQEYVGLLSFDISVPIKENIELYSNGYFDSTYTINYTVLGYEPKSFYSLPTYNISDTIFFSIGKIGFYPDYQTTISFHIDSINNKLYNFVYDYHQLSTPSYPESDETAYISFSVMDFYTSGDTLFAKRSGNECMKELGAASYTYYYKPLPYPNAINKKETTYGIRYEDTSEFKYSVILLFHRNLSVSLPNFLQINNFLLNHQINFLFHTSDHLQPLIIYDILGRELKRIEIPSGVSEYSLQQGQLPTGYYFARLGSSGAKFLVY